MLSAGLFSTENIIFFNKIVYFVITVSPFFIFLNPLYSKCFPFIYTIVLPLILTYIIYLPIFSCSKVAESEIK